MNKSLVIVESPAKARTIGRFLGRRYTVKASVGHIRDLPKSQLGVDIEDGFQPKYITIRGKGPILQELRKAAQKADTVLFATDPDREGEAISWHLAEALKVQGDKPCRIEFHEITKRAIQEAIKSPRPISQQLVNAQQARRILDRLVGYKLSPLLWVKVKKGLSAGRVQSVAVRLICDREAEIDAFVPEEYWTIEVELRPEKEDYGKQAFEARLYRIAGRKAEIKDQEQAKAIAAAVKKEKFVVESVRRREKRRYPAPPFTTSSLQQEASRKLGFAAGRTMRVAQQLYEGLDIGEEGTVGLITYIRTDATRVAVEAQQAARAVIESIYGKEYLPPQPPHYKTRAGAQAAHEAIRPTGVERTPSRIKPYVTRDQYRLYKLIWERFVASQMAPAVMDTLTVDITAGQYQFRATGSAVKFPGFMTLYIENTDDDTEKKSEKETLPDLTEHDVLQLLQVRPNQHFTQPPPRYSEAMLVKTLEELGIGRPSTYAQIIDTIQKRGYVVLEEKRFKPTELGKVVVELLKQHFPRIIDVEFTAQMEEQLDEIEEGKVEWVAVLEKFWQSFRRNLEAAHHLMEEVEIEDEKTDEVCEKCGRNMVIKHGRYGKFLACPGFPECRNTRPLLEEIGVKCPECGGEIVKRRSKRGRTFYGCSNYPDCRFTSWRQPTGQTCPRCGHYLVLKRARKNGDQIVCSNRGCSYQVAASDRQKDRAGG